jgi:hypothetical protein
MKLNKPQRSDRRVQQNTPWKIAMDKNTTCKDSKGKIRQIGEKWYGNHDCNSCRCNCPSDGDARCACTRMACVPWIDIDKWKMTNAYGDRKWWK